MQFEEEGIEKKKKKKELQFNNGEDKLIRRKWYEMLFNSNKQYCMNKSWVNIIKWHLFQFLMVEINLRWLKINLTTENLGG